MIAGTSEKVRLAPSASRTNDLRLFTYGAFRRFAIRHLLPPPV